jgi:hypothetical protein
MKPVPATKERKIRHEPATVKALREKKCQKALLDCTPRDRTNKCTSLLRAAIRPEAIAGNSLVVEDFLINPTLRVCVSYGFSSCDPCDLIRRRLIRPDASRTLAPQVSFPMYKRVPCNPHRDPRYGAVVVELAILLPFLAFCFIVAVDFCRIFYYTQVVQNAAETGALYGCRDSTYAANTTGIQTAATGDASDLSPAPSVGSTQGTDADGNATVSVTVSFKFKTITNYPGIPSVTMITRTVTMRVCPGNVPSSGGS